MADEKGNATEKNQEPKPRAPETLPDEVPESNMDKVSGGKIGSLNDSY